MDYEDLILQRQEAIEIGEDGGCCGDCEMCAFVDWLFNPDGRNIPYCAIYGYEL